MEKFNDIQFLVFEKSTIEQTELYLNLSSNFVMLEFSQSYEMLQFICIDVTLSRIFSVKLN